MSASSTPAPSGARLKVLVIEDNRDQAETLRALVDAWGHDVRVEHTGLAGVRQAEGWHPDAVIVDIRLPGALDGLAVVRILRRQPAMSGTRFIGTSGFVRPAATRLEEAQFDAFLLKPFPPTVLQASLGATPSV
jgi:CheY-like chemotaxis protein